MKTFLKTSLALSLIASMAISCGSDDDSSTDSSTDKSDLTLNISGLENLGSDFVYEGWMMVDGAPVTTGRFTVNDAGALSKSVFALDEIMLNKATAFILTIEPATGDDPAPSDVHILAGDFSGNSGNMTIAHQAALNTDFKMAEGKYILATPSTSDMTDENEGVWFLDMSSGSPMNALTLPTLPSGWVYEGWAIIDGKPISSGRFTDGSMADMDGNPFKGSEGVPSFPGEDFIMGMSNGVDLSAAQHIEKVVISVEPKVDNSPAPFTLKPLVGGDLTATSATGSLMDLNQNLSFPTGTFKR